MLSATTIVRGAYSSWASARRQAVVLSEFGGLSLAPADGEEWFGYATVGTADEFLERFAALVDALLDNAEIGVLYTQLTDTEQERNGLLGADRLRSWTRSGSGRSSNDRRGRYWGRRSTPAPITGLGDGVDHPA